MVVKLLLIVLVSAGVFWFIGRAWPKIKIRTVFKGQILPLLASPVAFALVKRLAWILLRLFLFRR